MNSIKKTINITSNPSPDISLINKYIDIFKFIKCEKLCSNNFDKYIEIAERYLSELKSEKIPESKLIDCGKFCISQLSIIPNGYREDILIKLIGKFSSAYQVDDQVILKAIFIFCIYSYSIEFMDKLKSDERVAIILKMENDIFLFQQFLKDELYCSK